MHQAIRPRNSAGRRAGIGIRRAEGPARDFARMVAAAIAAARATIGGWRMRRAGASGSMARRAAGICMASSPDIPAPASPMPSCRRRAISVSCAVPRIRRSWSTAAAALGLSAIALTDRNSLAGVVRAHVAAKQAGIRFIVGARLDFRCGRSLLAYPTDRAAYGRLCRLITLGRRRAPKGECHLDLADLDSYGEGLILISLPPEYGQPRGGARRLSASISPGAFRARSISQASISIAATIDRRLDRLARSWPSAASRHWSPSTTSMPMSPPASRCRIC